MHVHPCGGVCVCSIDIMFYLQNISVKPIIMHAMAEWYIRGDSDQTKLSRILDVAQDLKVITVCVTWQS